MSTYLSIPLLFLITLFGMGCGDNRDMSQHNAYKEKVDQLMNGLKPPTAFIAGTAPNSTSTVKWLKDNFDVEVPIFKWNISLPEAFYWDETDVFTSPLTATHEMRLLYSTSSKDTPPSLNRINKRIYLYDAIAEDWKLISETIFDPETTEIQRNNNLWNMSQFTETLCKEYQEHKQTTDNFLKRLINEGL